jgi:hypothetical protein
MRLSEDSVSGLEVKQMNENSPSWMSEDCSNVANRPMRLLSPMDLSAESLPRSALAGRYPGITSG